MTTRKTIALTRQTFVGQVMSAFQYAVYVGHNFPSKEEASFNFMAAVTICRDFGTQNIKSDTVSTVSASISHGVMGPDAMIFVF